MIVKMIIIYNSLYIVNSIKEGTFVFSPLLFVLIIAVCDDFIRCINLVSLALQFAAGDDEGSGGDVADSVSWNWELTDQPRLPLVGKAPNARWAPWVGVPPNERERESER